MSNVTQQYREIQRHALRGERIRIVDATVSGGFYANGDELIVVDEAAGVYPGTVKATGIPRRIVSEEYVVLEPIAPVAASLPDLFAQFIRDNAPAVRNYLAELDPIESAEVNEKVSVSEPQLTRAKVIEMARERVAELGRIGRMTREDLPKGTPFQGRFYRVEFHVNRDKRTVTALIRSWSSGSKPDAVGIAKATPDDVFNADIGKAIAAERALGLTLTDAFVNAPKPAPTSGAKVRKITGRNIGRVFTLTRRRPDCDGMGYGGNAFNTVESGWIGGSQYVIIDDTDADYEDGEAA